MYFEFAQKNYNIQQIDAIRSRPETDGTLKNFEISRDELILIDRDVDYEDSDDDGDVCDGNDEDSVCDDGDDNVCDDEVTAATMTFVTTAPGRRSK